MVFDTNTIDSTTRRIGIDYDETKDTFIIYNVPILAAMVQQYNDGLALKSPDEISKVVVDNVPLTMVEHKPSHPESHLSDMENTKQVANVTVGYMKEVSKPKSDMSKLKKYADFVLYKVPKTKSVIDAYLKEHIIDTSIGFRFDQDLTSGEFNGVRYDYVQRNIKLDHNAILMDAFGNIAEGRMPSPIGGIGADSNDTKGVRMEQKDIDALQAKAADMQKELDELKASSSVVIAERDSIKKDMDTMKVEMATLKSESDAMQKQLDGYKAKEKAEIDAMRAELKAKYADVSEVFDSASDDLIRQKFEAMQKKKTDKSDKGIGADMMGPKLVKAQSEHQRIENWANGTKKQ